MLNKKEWAFLTVLFIFAVITTVFFPPSAGIEGSDGRTGFDVFEVSAATSDESGMRGDSFPPGP